MQIFGQDHARFILVELSQLLPSALICCSGYRTSTCHHRANSCVLEVPDILFIIARNEVLVLSDRLT